MTPNRHQVPQDHINLHAAAHGRRSRKTWLQRNALTIIFSAPTVITIVAMVLWEYGAFSG